MKLLDTHGVMDAIIAVSWQLKPVASPVSLEEIQNLRRRGNKNADVKVSHINPGNDRGNSLINLIYPNIIFI